MSHFIRTVDFDAFENKGYEYRVLYTGESCRIIASHVAPRSAAPPLHVHKVDQVYYVTKGEMHVLLGDTEHVAPKDSCVYIPAGTPHRNWNEGDEPEFHFEVLAAAPSVTEPVVWLVDSDPTPETAAYSARLNWEPDPKAAERARVRKLSEEPDVLPAMPGFRRRWMVSGEDMGYRESDGWGNCIMYVADMDRGDRGPAPHVHYCDQFYFVLEGELSVKVGLDEAIVGDHTLVVLPEMVPHSLYNATSDHERHISLVAPVPPPEVPTDHFVNFGITGEVGTMADPRLGYGDDE